MDALKTGQLISQKRKALGMTQSDLAKVLHVSTQAVSKWERGLNFPDLTLMEPLAQTLALTVTQLLSGVEDAPAGEETVRDSLRLGQAQLGPRLRRWRSLFFAVAAALTLLLSWWGYTWVRENTEWLPQEETVLVPRDVDDMDVILSQLMGNEAMGVIEVTRADDLNGHQIRLELWEGPEMTQCWELRRMEEKHTDGARRADLTFLLSVDGTEVSYSIGYDGVLSRGAGQSIPYSGGWGWNVLTQPTVVDRETGTVVAAVALDVGRGVQTRAMQVGNFDSPGLDEGFGVLLLRFLPLR